MTMQRRQPDGSGSVPERPEEDSVVESARGYARGLLGGLLVGIPLLATMEMWWLGFSIPWWKMLLFLALNYGVLLVLEAYSGYQDHVGLRREALDALSAYGLGLLVAALTLYLFRLLGPGMSLREIAGKIILQSIPLSIGVTIARSQLGQSDRESKERKRESSFWGTQLIGLAGAVYFGFNVAPTEEPMLLGLHIGWQHAVLLVLFGLLQSHAIVYSVDFQGGNRLAEGSSWWGSVVTHGVTSYLVALLAAAYLLWTFGRIGPDTGLAETLDMIVVLGFVNSLGSAAAKLIL